MPGIRWQPTGDTVFAMARYALAYSIPLIAALGLWHGGAWSWVTVIYVYVLVPLLDFRVGVSARELPGISGADVLLVAALPIQLGVMGFFASRWSLEVTILERVGAILSVGIVGGAFAIVVAHELIHRRRGLEYQLGKLLLMTVGYVHFAIEHVRGHHERVATNLDPASARQGQSLYEFLPQSILRQARSAWLLEKQRLAGKGRRVWGWGNELLRDGLLQFVAWVLWAFVFGWSATAACLACAAVAIFMLEAVNYIEHYGLRREKQANGRLEPVKSYHSWNSDHVVSRAVLFELPRHSDHHRNGGRPFQTLRSVDGAPQLPAGYPAMMLLAMLPPLWFKVMNPRVLAARALATRP